MESAKNNNLILGERNNIARKKPISFDIVMSLIYMVLIMAGVFNNIGSIAAFLLIVIVFYTISLENIVAQMMFLMSFSVVFKLSPSSTSLFTVIEFYVVLLMLWRRPVFKAKELFVLVLIAISVLLGVLFSSNLQILLSIKFIAAMLLVMGFKNTDYHNELPRFVSLFILGLLISSAIAYFGSDIKQIDLYIVRDRVVESNWQGHYYTDIFRFSGLNADPNYYSVNIYIAMIGALVLDNKGLFKNRVLVYCGVIALFVFGILTVSKSFAFMAMLFVLYLIFVMVKNKKFGLLLLFLSIILIFAVFAFSGKIEIFNTLFNRITGSIDEGNLTTGRNLIWQRYFNYLAENPTIIPFGAGFGYGFGGLGAAHNAYVESITCLGVIGTTLLFIFLCILFSKENMSQKRSLENYSVLFVVIIMYFFLSMLTWGDLPMHLFLTYAFLNFEDGKVVK